MVKDFTNKVARLEQKHFAEVVRQSLNEVLGESSSLSSIYHMGGVEAIQDPKVFQKKVKVVFGEGADVILKRVIENVNPKT